MENKPCLFCRIINKSLEAKIVYEDELIMAIEDRFPKAPVHILVLPKAHIVNLFDLQPEHKDILWHLMEKLPVLATQLGLESGFRTITNSGVDGGQSVFHMHFHLLGGNDLPGL